MFNICLIIVLLGVVDEDAFSLSLYQIGAMNIFLVDIAILATFIVILLNWRILIITGNKSILLPLLIFMGWMLVCILKGMGHFSFSAIGEARIVLVLLFFAVSYSFIMHSRSGPSVLDSLGKLLALAAVGVLVVFLLELSVGHRLSLEMMENPEVAYGYLVDERGIRILGTLQSFTAGVFFIFVCVNILQKKKIPFSYKLLGMVMPIILIVSLNRAALISIVFGLVFYGLFFTKSGQRIKIVAIMVITFMTVFLTMKYVFPERLDALELLVVSATNPEEEGTGNWEWRMAVEFAAYQVFLENPITGEGFGGYWDYYIGGRQTKAPPHNQYLLLLSKSGTIGLVLFIFVILAVLKNYLRSRNYIPDYARPLFDTMLIIVIASIPYGFAYGYVQTYGFYLGIFAGILHRSLFERQNVTNLQTPIALARVNLL